MSTHHVVILGAGSAGLSAARTLAAHPQITVTLVGQTGERPYTRMLIKGVAFGDIAPEAIRARLPKTEFVTDSALSVDSEAREVALESGVRLSFDSLIVATGSHPRELAPAVPGTAEAARRGVLTTLHSVEDAARIAARLEASFERLPVVIYGAGLTAAETASSLRSLGHPVALVARSEQPGVASFGAAIAERIAAAHGEHVETHFGRTMSSISSGAVGDADATATVLLDDGTELQAALVIVATGTLPHAPNPWPAGVVVDAGLGVTGAASSAEDIDGFGAAGAVDTAGATVETGETGETVATGAPGDTSGIPAPGIYAAGGVAIHRGGPLGNWRIDHWEDASEQGAHAARRVLFSLGLADDPGDYLPRSAHLAMIYGHTVAAAGYTGIPGADPDDAGVSLHERGGVVVGASAIDAVGPVYQWAQLLHGAGR
ncbi:FAD-dependent oxidoreductase [Leucobacter sp. BZR 635]